MLFGIGVPGFVAYAARIPSLSIPGLPQPVTLLRALPPGHTPDGPPACVDGSSFPADGGVQLQPRD